MRIEVDVNYYYAYIDGGDGSVVTVRRTEEGDTVKECLDKAVAWVNDNIKGAHRNAFLGGYREVNETYSHPVHRSLGLL